MGMELADRVAGLEVGQTQTGHDVAAAGDEDGEVEQVEEEVEVGRERGDDEDDGGDDEGETSKHPPAFRSRVRCARSLQALGAVVAAMSRGPPVMTAGVSTEIVPSSSRTTRPGRDIVDGRTRLDDQPVGQCGLSEDLDVVRDDAVAPEQRGERLTGPYSAIEPRGEAPR